MKYQQFKDFADELDSYVANNDRIVQIDVSLDFWQTLQNVDSGFTQNVTSPLFGIRVVVSNYLPPEKPYLIITQKLLRRLSLTPSYIYKVMEGI